MNNPESQEEAEYWAEANDIGDNETDCPEDFEKIEKDKGESFKEQFPGLKDYFEIHCGFPEKMEWCHDCVNFVIISKDHAPEHTTHYNYFFRKPDIQAHCIDKQKVRDVIDNVEKEFKNFGFLVYIIIEQIKKKLGL